MNTGIVADFMQFVKYIGYESLTFPLFYVFMPLIAVGQRSSKWLGLKGQKIRPDLCPEMGQDAVHFEDAQPSNA